MFLCKIVAVVLILAIGANGEAAVAVAGAGGAPTLVTNTTVPDNGTREGVELLAEKEKLEKMWDLLNETVRELKGYEERTKEALQNASYEDGIHHPRIHDLPLDMTVMDKSGMKNNGGSVPQQFLGLLMMSFVIATAAGADAIGHGNDQ